VKAGWLGEVRIRKAEKVEAVEMEGEGNCTTGIHNFQDWCSHLVTN
jgi:hypothetical protein